MPDRAISPEELILLLERLRLSSAGEKHAPDVTLEQVDVLLARIASLTEALRDAKEDETAQLTSRILIGDLSCALEFSWTLDCERVLAEGVSR